jgi:hypothetical protein
MALGTSMRKSKIICFPLSGMLLGYLLIQPAGMLAARTGAVEVQTDKLRRSDLNLDNIMLLHC